jgi:hypothetical protein
MFLLIKNSFKIKPIKSFKFQNNFYICNTIYRYDSNDSLVNNNNNNNNNIKNVNESLKNHIIKKLNESFISWVSLTPAKEDLNNKISSISNNILLNLINDHIFIQSKPFDKKILESVKLISKALKSCPSDLNLINDNYIDIGSLLVLYKQKLELNHQIFTQINNHHAKISNEINNKNNWNEIVNDTISLNTYSNAAKNMGTILFIKINK